MVEELILSGADIVKVRWHHYLEMIWQYYNTYHLICSSIHLISCSALLSYCVFLSQRCLHHICIVQLINFSSDCHDVLTKHSSLLRLNLKKAVISIKYSLICNMMICHNRLESDQVLSALHENKLVLDIHNCLLSWNVLIQVGGVWLCGVVWCGVGLRSLKSGGIHINCNPLLTNF